MQRKTPKDKPNDPPKELSKPTKRLTKSPIKDNQKINQKACQKYSQIIAARTAKRVKNWRSANEIRRKPVGRIGIRVKREGKEKPDQ
ncbi:unnamed protein product [Blepharisma stoltei]|uniref:Uncharacterized protein n=1 Tax=Blepharisma stoltei TaxID=1481888 RepID=A0AAU9IM52_9CILI|nr:unnamed protein product [Blepharisma stoltei]